MPNPNKMISNGQRVRNITESMPKRKTNPSKSESQLLVYLIHCPHFTDKGSEATERMDLKESFKGARQENRER